MPAVYAYVLVTPRTSCPGCWLVSTLYRCRGVPDKRATRGRVHAPRSPTRADTRKTRSLTTPVTNALHLCMQKGCILWAIFRFSGLWRGSRGVVARYDDDGTSGGKGCKKPFFFPLKGGVGGAFMFSCGVEKHRAFCGRR
jgi:hypothetical protein